MYALAENNSPSWWSQQTTTSKVAFCAIGAGALYVLWSMTGSSHESRFTPNARRKRASKRAVAKARKRGGAYFWGLKRSPRARRKARSMKESSWCHKSPPAKYARHGATQKSDYAFPECFKYPVRGTTEKWSRAHTKAAASYFARHQWNIPEKYRAKVRARIDRERKHWGIGPYRKAA
jgi:hypothetical protein